MRSSWHQGPQISSACMPWASRAGEARPPSRDGRPSTRRPAKSFSVASRGSGVPRQSSPGAQKALRSPGVPCASAGVRGGAEAQSPPAAGPRMSRGVRSPGPGPGPHGAAVLGPDPRAAAVGPRPRRRRPPGDRPAWSREGSSDGRTGAGRLAAMVPGVGATPLAARGNRAPSRASTVCLSEVPVLRPPGAPAPAPLASAALRGRRAMAKNGPAPSHGSARKGSGTWLSPWPGPRPGLPGATSPGAAGRLPGPRKSPATGVPTIRSAGAPALLCRGFRRGRTHLSTLKTKPAIDGPAAATRFGAKWWAGQSAVAAPLAGPDRQ